MLSHRLFHTRCAFLKRLGLMGVALAVVSCATIMHGAHQTLRVGSTPTGASVFVDRQPIGATPVMAKLSRKKSHVVRIEMAGYQPYEATLVRRVSGWVWGNIVFGGLVGLVVDMATGGLYKLTPDQIQTELKKDGMGARVGEDTILISVTLAPDPSWERIGRLDRIAGN